MPVKYKISGEAAERIARYYAKPIAKAFPLVSLQSVAPARFPLGSPESRAAARALAEASGTAPVLQDEGDFFLLLAGQVFTWVGANAALEALRRTGMLPPQVDTVTDS